MPSPLVKCVDCGFLAVRDEYNETVCEATEITRKKGEHKSSNGNSTPARIFCYMNSPAFKPPDDSSTAPSIHHPKSSNPIVAVINEDKDCPLFRAWHPGKTPKEHEEMSILDQVRAENSLAQAKQKDRQDAADARAQRNQCVTWCISIVALLIAIGAALANVIKLFSSAS